MKKRFLVAVLILSFFSFTSIIAYADNWDSSVWIASESTSAFRYHNTSTCPSLSRSVVGEITLQEAALAGFTPCEICKPPNPIPPIEATPRPENNKGNNWGSFTTAAPGHVQRYTDSPIIAASTEKECVLVIISAFAIFLLAILFAYYFIIKRREKNRLKEIEKLRREEWLIKKQEYEKLYGGVSTLVLSQAPNDCTVGPDGMPACNNGNEKWGNKYTVYMTASGHSFHKKDCRIIKGKTFSAINAYKVLHGSNYFRGDHYCPCAICHPTLPDMTWYERYKKIESIKKRYKIE